jgi:hypothetical protein
MLRGSFEGDVAQDRLPPNRGGRHAVPLAVRSRPTYCQGNAWSPLTVAVELEAGGAVLVLVFGGARPDSWMGESISVATPAAVASAVRGAIEAGWEGDGNGGPAFFGVETGRLASSMGGVSAQHNDAVTQDREGAWQPYDPEWLVNLAEEQHPDVAWLPGSLRACRRVRPETRAYVHFVDPAPPAWRFEGNIVLESPEHGTLVLDILEGEVVGGVEFLNRL